MQCEAKRERERALNLPDRKVSGGEGIAPGDILSILLGIDHSKHVDICHITSASVPGHAGAGYSVVCAREDAPAGKRAKGATRRTCAWLLRTLKGRSEGEGAGR
ncbi:hypothetical protein MPTK1_8g00040 [Marchantia polymorpha subsp. ruderalis]|uniref:Uncharacterized protein n=1 Tax=Marchantia polymorpha TaxID=3197 RepID=A0A2R6WLL4_MARPO|nr:hypothetical protein MARPO_0077s0064 [Marchantia polymorpha]BBN18134.1 hypothetical protein Mp_8g00040 [Marchantia polymorpha subsp. ruderalis]|eukprot:PTQ34748.1 hypothetical protein MARPO_0077s0064 [Marchantia polymorpha]